MAYKRQIDRLPIIPAYAKESNVTCHYCIVGCGYKTYTWAASKQGGTAPDQNKFGVDLSKQQGRRPQPGIRPRCTTSFARTGRTYTSSSSPTRTAS